MSGVNAWASSLCIVAAVCAALRMITPKNGMGRIVKIIMAAVIVICMISPLTKLGSLANELPDSTVAVGDNAGQQLSAVVEEQLKSQAEAVIDDILKTALAGVGGEREILVRKVEINMDTGSDGRIYINGVTLFLDKQNMPDALIVRQAAGQALGVEVDVTEYIWEG